MLDNLDVQKYNNTQFGAATGGFGMNPQAAVTMPSMQAIDATKINEAATDTYLGQRLTSFSDIDPLLQYGVTIPTWIAINQAMERYNKACRGDYNKAIISKFGRFGDKISNILFDNPIGRALNKAANSGKSAFKNVIYDNSALVRAFDKTSSQPELSMIKSQMGGIPTMLSHDSMNILEEYLKPLQSAKDFDSLGISKAEIQRIESGAAKIIGAENKALYLQTEEFKILNKGASAQQIQGFKNMDAAKRIAHLKELKAKSLGFANITEFEAIKAAPEKHLNKIMEVLKNNSEKYSRISYSNKNFGTILKGEITGRKVQLGETYNKLLAAMGGNHTTKLGKTFAKLSNYILEGASSRISGGKVAALMQAYFLAEVLIRANRQEGASNKFKSFMERFAELIGFFVFMGPSVKLMHKIGGLQYSGMTKEQVEAYRQAVKEFNEHVMNCDWTKDVYKVKRKELRAKFRPHTKNPFVYLARKVGDIITVGLEQVRPYTKHKVDKVDLTITKIMESPLQYLKNIPKRLKDVARNPKYWLKQMAGYPVRFLLPMVVIMPFFNKYLVKGVNAIFGKPTEGALADEGKEEEQAQANEQPKEQVHYANNTSAVAPALAAAEVKPDMPKAVKQGSSVTYTGSDAKAAEAQEKADQNNSKTEQADIPKNRYIPSTNPVKTKAESTDELDKLLKRADKIEKNAIETLSI